MWEVTATGKDVHEPKGQIKIRAFRVVAATDEIFRDFAIKAQDKKNKRGSRPDGITVPEMPGGS